jgi:DNA-binding NarL/FixJ family response regulator
MLRQPINLAIADDHTLFRKILKGFLSQQSIFKVTIEASNSFDLIEQLKMMPAEIVVMDVFMPKIGCSEALEVIRNEFPDTKVIILSMSTNLELINELLDIGIHAYISKSDEPESLVHAIKSAHEDHIYRNKLFTDALYHHNHVNLKKGAKNNNIHFDEREVRVLQLLWEEKSNKDIANEIFLSVRSVEKIRQDLKERLGVRSTIGLLKYALNNRIIRDNQLMSYVKAGNS